MKFIYNSPNLFSYLFFCNVYCKLYNIDSFHLKRFEDVNNQYIKQAEAINNQIKSPVKPGKTKSEQEVSMTGTSKSQENVPPWSEPTVQGQY